MPICNICRMIEAPEVHINGCGIADYPAGATLGPRTLRDFEIVWIDRGDCLWKPEGESISCPPGTVLLCQPGMRDEFTWDSSTITRHGYLHFRFLTAAGVALPLWRQCGNDDVLRPLLRHAVWLSGQDSTETDHLATMALRQALTWFINGYVARDGQASTANQHPVLERAFRTLRRYWAEEPLVPPGIAVWASDSGVSRGHLSRVCKDQLGITPQELLRSLRLDHGLTLLTRSNLKVQRISELCGFVSPFHFSRCFKQIYGSSPSVLRQQVMDGKCIPPDPMAGLRHIRQQLLAKTLR